MYVEEQIKLLQDEVSQLKETLDLLKGTVYQNQRESFLSTNEASKRLNISRGALLGQIRNGKIKAIKTNLESKYSRYKVSEEEIEKLLEIRRTKNFS